jgi:SNF2 family DNA or RNA helicase
LRLSLLAAPLLAGLSEDIGQFDGDAGWQQCNKRDSLRAFQQVPATLQASLRPYQQSFAWLSRLAHIGAGACLADDMGLGKTVQTLALLLSRAHLGPQLVVAPTSVALNWLAEAARFAPSLRLRPYQQQRDLSTVGPQDLVIASYGLLQLQADDFAEVHWASVVLDEAQAIKNANTKRAQAAQSLRADFRLAASGTPVENHLGELWSLFRFITPGLLGNEDKFQQRFAQPLPRATKKPAPRSRR